ncbi:hypothetical protein V8C35DRAFT_303592 [Trichoderma chlorosporum]
MHASALVAALRVAQTQAEWRAPATTSVARPWNFPHFDVFSALPLRSGASEPFGLRLHAPSYA